MLAKTHTSLFVRAAPELSDTGAEKGLQAQLCAVLIPGHHFATSMHTRNLDEVIILGSQRKSLVALISLEDFEHKVNVSFPQHMPGSHADVKITKRKLPHTASCAMMPFKGLMFYTLQFTTFTACSLNG